MLKINDGVADFKVSDIDRGLKLIKGVKQRVTSMKLAGSYDIAKFAPLFNAICSLPHLREFHDLTDYTESEPALKDYRTGNLHVIWFYKPGKLQKFNALRPDTALRRVFYGPPGCCVYPRGYETMAKLIASDAYPSPTKGLPSIWAISLTKMRRLTPDLARRLTKNTRHRVLFSRVRMAVCKKFGSEITACIMTHLRIDDWVCPKNNYNADKALVTRTIKYLKCNEICTENMRIINRKRAQTEIVQAEGEIHHKEIVALLKKRK